MATIPPCFRVAHEAPDLSALQALSRGDASPEQQIRALKWIVNEASATYQQTFLPSDPHGSSFLEGRRFVGLKIVSLLTVSITDYLKKNAPKENHGPQRPGTRTST